MQHSFHLRKFKTSRLQCKETALGEDVGAKAWKTEDK